jgi:asparagine synthase (glutamine-hydrolysing)
MCGITGKIYFDSNRLIDPSELKQMTDIIIHRGPDDEGFFIEKNIGLGFRRLSIIDLKTGHQPLSNREKTMWITFNGEIYNYLQIKRHLQEKGFIFTTQTDTEVILLLYEAYGEKCLDYLRGMFAFVIWDKEKNVLFGARDRFGIKPFHYYIDNEQFLWASEIKSLRINLSGKLSLDYESLNEYFTYGYIGNSRSIYREVKKIPPAHYFILNIDKPVHSVQLKKYWQIQYEPDYTIKENEWIQLLEEKFAESVKLHMISDVPLGAFLSGGVDSSAVVAFMSRVSDIPVKTFSIGFKESEYNELEFAREVSASYKTEHHELILEPESIELLPILVQAYDEPFYDSSAIPSYYVSKFAHEKVTVVLSGDGGDELFGGYDNYSKVLQLNNSFFNKEIFKPIWQSLHQILPDKFYGKGYSYYQSHSIEILGAYFCLWKMKERETIFNNETKSKIKHFNFEQYKLDILKSTYHTDKLDRLQYLDLRTYLPDDILTKVDRVSMQNSLETRVPILDHELAELSFKIPSELKIKNYEKKYIFKRMLKNYLPDKVLNHRKQGFQIPVSIWFRDSLYEYINDNLLRKNSRINEFVNPVKVAKLIQNHTVGMRNFADQIWSLLFLEEWLKQNH